MLKVLLAKHRLAYLKLAFKHWTTPGHVYELAHGKQPHGQKDSDICHDLLDMKIVHRHHHSHDPNHYQMD